MNTNEVMCDVYLENVSWCEGFILHIGLYLADDSVGDIVLVVFEEALQEFAGVL